MNRQTSVAIVLMAMIVCAHGWGITSIIKQFTPRPVRGSVLRRAFLGASSTGDQQIKALKDLRAEDEASYQLIADILVNDADIGPVLSSRLRHQLDEVTKPDHEMELLDVLKET